MGAAAMGEPWQGGTAPWVLRGCRWAQLPRGAFRLAAPYLDGRRSQQPRGERGRWGSTQSSSPCEKQRGTKPTAGGCPEGRPRAAPIDTVTSRSPEQFNLKFGQEVSEAQGMQPERELETVRKRMLRLQPEQGRLPAFHSNTLVPSPSLLRHKNKRPICILFHREKNEGRKKTQGRKALGSPARSHSRRGAHSTAQHSIV